MIKKFWFFIKEHVGWIIFLLLIYFCYFLIFELKFENQILEEIQKGVQKNIWYYINSLLFFGTLVCFLRTPIKQAFSQRKNIIKDDIENSKKLFEDTKKEYEEIKNKVLNIKSERAKIREDIINEANRQADEIIQNASKRAALLQESASLMIQSEEKKALTGLSLQFSEILIQEAKKEIKSSLSDDLEDRLIDKGLERIQEVFNG